MCYGFLCHFVHLYAQFHEVKFIVTIPYVLLIGIFKSTVNNVLPRLGGTKLNSR